MDPDLAVDRASDHTESFAQLGNFCEVFWQARHSQATGLKALPCLVGGLDEVSMQHVTAHLLPVDVITDLTQLVPILLLKLQEAIGLAVA